jgi:hypothetical protein
VAEGELTVLAYFLGSLALAAGLGLVILALLKLEGREDRGHVSKGWRKDHGGYVR